MKIGKLALMTGAAAIAMAAAAANAAETKKSTPANTQASQPNLVLAQNTPASSSNSGISNAELAARIQALEDAQAAAADRSASDRTRLSTLEQNYNSAAWSFDNGRPTFASGDGRFTMAIRARFQADFAGFSQDSTHGAGFAGPTDLSSGAVMRRAYLGIEGKAYSDFNYEIRLNAGGTNGGSAGASGVPTAGEGDPLLNKAVITYTGIPNWHFNVGVLEPAFMFEGTTSSASLMFLERPEIDNIAADSFGAGDSRRGIEVGWAKTDTFWAGDNVTATFTFSGAKTGSTAGHGNGGDEQSQVLGRITDRLWTDGLSNIQAGVSLARILYSGNAAGGGSQTINLQDRPEIRVDGTRLISTGGVAAKTGDMVAFDLGGNIDNFFLGGEWAQFSLDRQCGSITAAANPTCTSTTAVIDHPTFSGWYIEGSWILTGETKVYSPTAINNEVGGFQAPIPSRPFSLSGDSWGAWELVARYSDTDLNWHDSQTATTGQLAGILGGEERIVALGINWYLNRNIRLMLDDNIIHVKKGTAALPDRDSQDINVLGLRVQYAN
ncbi:MAG TPA: porin [Rhizomicrobium sp.]|nr:porin [Rhizomicrobium sp.]